MKISKTSIMGVLGLCFSYKIFVVFLVSSITVFTFFPVLFLILFLGVCISPTGWVLCYNLNDFIAKIYRKVTGAIFCTSVIYEFGFFEQYYIFKGKKLASRRYFDNIHLLVSNLLHKIYLCRRR